MVLHLRVSRTKLKEINEMRLHQPTSHNTCRYRIYITNKKKISVYAIINKKKLNYLWFGCESYMLGRLINLIIFKNTSLFFYCITIFFQY